MTSTNYNLQAMTNAMNREADMTDIKTEVNRYAELATEQAETLSRMIEHGSEWPTYMELDEDYGLDDDSDWIDLLNVMALELYGTKRVGTYQPNELQSVTVITGTGGPHVEFEVTPDGRLEGRAYWGSESATRTEYGFQDLFDSLAELVDIREETQ